MSAEPAEHGREVSVIAARHPDRPAVVASSGSLTFAQLDHRAEALARHFADRGLDHGDPIALLATNRPEWLVVQQAALRSGLALVPVNWHLEADDIAHVVTDSGASVVIVEARFADLIPAGVDRIVIDGPSGALVDDDTTDEGEDFDEDQAFAEVVGRAHGPAPTRRRGSLMIYTSGTTGRPKGVRHREATAGGAAVGAAMVAMFAMDGDRGDSMLCPAPLYHSGPSRLCSEWPIGAGVTVHLMERFDAEQALVLIERHHITHAFFVPTMFHRLLAVPDRERFDVSSLRFVLHGAGPCPVAVKAAMFDWLGPIIHEMYAASEGPGTWIGPDEWLAHPGSVGRVDGDRLEIRDDHGRRCPSDAEGTVWFRADAPFDYHDDPAKTAATHDASGEWYTVGDRGRIDGDGYLYLAGRTAECIVSGGVNLYPARIDDALASHPDLLDGAAFGVPDAEYGEIVAAAVVPAGTFDPDQLTASVLDHCRTQLGAQLTPRAVHIVDQLPRSDAGKLYRRRLVDQFSPTPTGVGPSHSNEETIPWP